MINPDNADNYTNDFPINYTIDKSGKIKIQDKDIISTIRLYCPNTMNDKFYYFPLNHKYFMTDKGVTFSIVYELRGLKTNELRNYNYHKNKGNDEKQNNLIDKANNLIPYLHIISDKRTSIRISIYDAIKSMAESYGYSVKTAKTPTYHFHYKKNNKGLLKRVKDKDNPYYSQYIELCISTFARICQHGKMVRKGYTINDLGVIVKIKRGRGDTRFSFIDTTTRKEYCFDSKKQAAQLFFHCDESTLRRAIKKGVGHSFAFNSIPYMITT